VQNYKVLQDCFKKVGISKKIPVQLLIRGKYQDNLEFMQWMKRFFELNHSGDEYNAVERRAKGKGGKAFTGNGKVQKKTTSREKRDLFNAGKTRPKKTSSAAAASASSSSSTTTTTSSSSAGGKMAEGNENRRSSNRTKRSTTQRRRPTATKSVGGSAAAAEVTASLRDKVSTLTSDKESLQTKTANLELTIDGLEKERDFYFGKLRDIEILLQETNDGEHDEGTSEQQLKLLIERGLKILYATEGEDFVAVTELVDAAAEPEEAAVAEAGAMPPSPEDAVTEAVVPPSPVAHSNEAEEEEVVVEGKQQEHLVEQEEEEEEEKDSAEPIEGKEGGDVETF
jgi:RP/EB family microtubule-associated protein